VFRSKFPIPRTDSELRESTAQVMRDELSTSRNLPIRVRRICRELYVQRVQHAVSVLQRDRHVPQPVSEDIETGQIRYR
jgi:hypothetical protein